MNCSPQPFTKLWNKLPKGFALAASFLALVTLAGGACLDPSQVATYGSCKIADDQKASFMTKLKGFPVTVIVDQNFRTLTPNIQAAVDEWNRYGKADLGADIFVLKKEQIPQEIKALDLQFCSSGFESANLYLVREEDRERWTKTLKFDAQTPAVTIRCSSGRDLYSQVVMIQTGYADLRQLSSIALHELGHSLGLNHSCDQGGGPNYIACDKVKSSHPYHEAVMFPSLLKLTGSGSTAMPETKENLRQNDIDRAACLYQK